MLILNKNPAETFVMKLCVPMLLQNIIEVCPLVSNEKESDVFIYFHAEPYLQNVNGTDKAFHATLPNFL